VAHPVFRPVKVETDSTKKLGSSDLISNGAFVVAKTETDVIRLKKAENYWDKGQVNLEEVSFVDTKNAEQALASYRDGEIDAVSNAAFEPLAIKLLSPFQDFRRETYGAVTYYTFNTTHHPFDDVRVREALSIAIDRDRISQDDLGGATEPAKRFLPEEMSASNQPVVGKSELLEKDVATARDLLTKAGFPDGQGFPKIRLLINRNEQQRLVAQSVAAMWRSALNIETEIVMKNWDEYELASRNGDFDLVRRGLVMQTTDELTNMRMMFRPEQAEPLQRDDRTATAQNGAVIRTPEVRIDDPIETEDQALRQLKAVPIYFASSYALVKPYVRGFDSNILDAPSLKAVKVDTTWSETRSK
jgi:oligopeptide transport system substrate-binding protein